MDWWALVGFFGGRDPRGCGRGKGSGAWVVDCRIVLIQILFRLLYLLHLTLIHSVLHTTYLFLYPNHHLGPRPAFPNPYIKSP